MLRRYLVLLVLVLLLLFPMAGWADTPACTDPASSSLCNPLATNKSIFPKIDNFTEFVIFSLQLFGGLAGIASILYLTFAGFQFLISQGAEEKLAKAKSTVQWTVSGLVLLMLSFVMVQALEQALKYQPIETPDKLANPIAITNFTQLYQALIEGFFGIMALVAVLMIIISGYKYVTAGGNEETTGEAKKTILYAIIGMAIALLGYVIIHSVGTFFGKD